MALRVVIRNTLPGVPQAIGEKCGPYVPSVRINVRNYGLLPCMRSAGQKHAMRIAKSKAIQAVHGRESGTEAGISAGVTNSRQTFRQWQMRMCKALGGD